MHEKGRGLEDRAPCGDEKRPIPDDNVTILDIIVPFSSNQGPFQSQSVTTHSFIVKVPSFTLLSPRVIGP